MEFYQILNSLKNQLDLSDDGKNIICNSDFIVALLNTDNERDFCSIIIEQARKDLIKTSKLIMNEVQRTDNIIVKEACYECKYFNKNARHWYKCCGPRCPSKLPQIKIDALLKDYESKL